MDVSMGALPGSKQVQYGAGEIKKLPGERRGQE